MSHERISLWNVYGILELLKHIDLHIGSQQCAPFLFLPALHIRGAMCEHADLRGLQTCDPLGEEPDQP